VLAEYLSIWDLLARRGLICVLVKHYSDSTGQDRTQAKNKQGSNTEDADVCTIDLFQSGL
ncbi:hypothetical protein ACJX0J_021880, partial [Zea mays]